MIGIPCDRAQLLLDKDATIRHLEEENRRILVEADVLKDNLQSTQLQVVGLKEKKKILTMEVKRLQRMGSTR